MDRAYFFDKLYPLQDEVIGVLSSAETGFYLPEPTALRRPGYPRGLPHERGDFGIDMDRDPGHYPSTLMGKYALRTCG